MPTRKIADLPKQWTCHHPEHNPPTMMHFEPGCYEHVCPGCGTITYFTVPQRDWAATQPWNVLPGQTVYTVPTKLIPTSSPVVAPWPLTLSNAKNSD